MWRGCSCAPCDAGELRRGGTQAVINFLHGPIYQETPPASLPCSLSLPPSLPPSLRPSLRPSPAARTYTLRAPPPPPSPRTKWTRRVPHPVLIGHAASLPPPTHRR